MIRELLPRTTLLVRRAAGEASLPQPLAANVDLGLVMTSANGDHRQRASIATSASSAMADPRSDRAARRSISSTIPRPSSLPLQAFARVVALSTVTGAGLAELRALVPPRATAVLLGSSGVGKSSLLNALVTSAALPTRPIDDDDRGRHTTTRRELFVADDGSLWIDTPGMRELARWASDEDMTTTTMIRSMTSPSSRPAAGFATASTPAEPGCAVVAATRAGELDAARLARFHTLGA